jgi:hypothetical protein
VVPTGIHHHAPMTLDALDAGCHVLLEKPAAATVDEVRQMRAASQAADRMVAIGYQHMAGLQMLCANAAFACAWIHSVEPEYLEPGSAECGKAVAIRGMEESCREAFSSEQLWSEMPLPWSRSAGAMEWDRFTSFPGVWKPSRLQETVLICPVARRTRI